MKGIGTRTHAEVRALSDLLGKMRSNGFVVDESTLDGILLGIVRGKGEWAGQAFARCPNCQTVLNDIAAYTDLGDQYLKKIGATQ